MSTSTIKIVHEVRNDLSLTPTAPRSDIQTEDITLYCVYRSEDNRHKHYVAVDSKTGKVVGKASYNSQYNKYGQWDLSNWRESILSRFVTTKRLDRLATIIPQWAKGIC